MAVDTAQTPWVWASTPDGRKVRLPKHLVEQSKNLTLAPSEKAKEPTTGGATTRAKEPAKNTTNSKVKESDR